VSIGNLPSGQQLDPQNSPMFQGASTPTRLMAPMIQLPKMFAQPGDSGGGIEDDLGAVQAKSEHLRGNGRS